MNNIFSQTFQRNSAFVTVMGACLAFATLAGCKSENSQEPVVPNEQVTEQVSDFPQFTSEIRSLSQEALSALGTKNDVPTEFVMPGAYFVQLIYPQRFQSVEKGDSAVEFFAQSSIQIPVKDLLAKSQLAISSKGFTFDVLKDAKTDAEIQTGFPTPVEVVYLALDETLDKEGVINEVFKNADQNKIKTEKIGNNEVRFFENPLLMQLDQTGNNIGKIDSICAGVSFPSENSVVFISGTPEALGAYFKNLNGDERGIAAQRLGRADVATAAAVFQYDYDSDVPNTQLVQLPIPVTPELMQAIQANVSAFQFSFDVSKADGDLLTLCVNTKSADGANVIRKAIGTALLKSVDNLTSMGKANQAQDQATLTSLVNLMKSVNLVANDQTVVGTIKNSKESFDFFANAIQNLNDSRNNAEIYSQYKIAEEVLFQISRAFTAYFGKNKTYPTPICDASGTPLLSWRVALLPFFGEQGQKLYDQFKLDEPWNSENNLKLLDQMPSVYASPIDPTLKNKTQYLIVNSPESPFGRAPQGLKLQDVADPSRTVSVVLTATSQAIEWTRPESFTFNPQKPSESFGQQLCAVTLLGEVVHFTCDDSEKTNKTIASLIYGVSDDETTENNDQDENADGPNEGSESETSPAVEESSVQSQENADEVSESAPAE